MHVHHEHVSIVFPLIGLINLVDLLGGNSSAQCLIRSGSDIHIKDCGAKFLQKVTVVVQDGAKVIWMSDTIYQELSFSIGAGSTVTYVQVVSGQFESAVQRLSMRCEQPNSHAIVRIFPILIKAQRFTCHTQQWHGASNGLTDVQVVGSLHNSAHCSHESDIQICQDLSHINVTQKTMLMLSGPNCTAYACPGFASLSRNICCVHGAVIGSVDKGQIEYLESRGIQASMARRLIVNGRFMDASKLLAPVAKEFILSIIST